MRVCLIGTEKLPVPPIRGGAIQTYIDGVLPGLGAVHQVTVICPADPDLAEREERNGIRWVRIKSDDRRTYFNQVAAFLAGANPFDLIELFNRPAYVPTVLSTSKGARLILSMHNDMFNADRITAHEARAVLDQVAGVAAISDHVRFTVDRLYPGYGAKMVTIRSGVDIERFCAPFAPEAAERRHLVRARLGLPPDIPVILHVSRFSAKKGNHLVFKAVEQVRQVHSRAVLLAVGSARYGSNLVDDYTADLMTQAIALGDGIRLTGFVRPDQIHDYFLAGDIFICASQWPEPLARVHYEAMASGLPIITTDRGGNAEAVAEGENGFFAQPHHEPQAFADLICRLIADPDLRLGMGRRGREIAVDRFTWQRVQQELLDLFAKAAGG